jgi:hypothetical protein
MTMKVEVTIECVTPKQLADVLALAEECDVPITINGALGDKASTRQKRTSQKKEFTKLSSPSLVVKFADKLPRNVSRTDLLNDLLKMKIKPMSRRDLSFLVRDHFHGPDGETPSHYGIPGVITRWIKEGTLIEA